MTNPNSRMARFDRAAEKVLKWLGIVAGMAAGLFVLLMLGFILYFWLTWGPDYSRYQAIAGSNQADFIYERGFPDSSWKLYIPSHTPSKIHWMADASIHLGGFSKIYWTNDGAVLVIMVSRRDQPDVQGYAYDYSQKKELGIQCDSAADPAKNAAIIQQIQQWIDQHGGLKQPGIDVQKEAKHVYSWQLPD